jgi:Uma2 family endonuclease
MSVTTADHAPPAAAGPPLAVRVPPLHTGDRLSREEFNRRFDATPHLRKAERIEGVVYMSPPVSHDSHSEPTFTAAGWLSLYRFATPGISGGENGTIRLDHDNDFQPDLYLIIRPERGGQTKIEDGYVVGAPELIFEVAASSASYDLHDKLVAYRRNGVLEYLVWRTFDGALDWFILDGSEYRRHEPGEDGVYRSEVFPGLWLDPAAMLSGDGMRLLDIARQGQASDEHAAFVKRLQGEKTE